MNREDMYMNEIAEMQKVNHCLMVRVKELSEEVAALKKQFGLDYDIRTENKESDGCSSALDGI